MRTKICVRAEIPNFLSKLCIFDGLIFERASRISVEDVFFGSNSIWSREARVNHSRKIGKTASNLHFLHMTYFNEETKIIKSAFIRWLRTGLWKALLLTMETLPHAGGWRRTGPGWPTAEQPARKPILSASALVHLLSQLARENTATLCRWRLVSEGPRSWPLSLEDCGEKAKVYTQGTPLSAVGQKGMKAAEH